MSNNWRDDTFSMVQLIQRDMEKNTRFMDMVVADGAQNHPIIEIDGRLHWEKTADMKLLMDFNLIDTDTLRHCVINDPSEDMKQIMRARGCSLEEYAELFHTKEC